MSTCSCVTYRLRGPNGEILEAISDLDPDCRKHGLREPIKGSGHYEDDWWPAGHPLRVHAGHIRVTEPGLIIGGRQLPDRHLWRLERPRETEQRLLREAKLGIPIPPLQPWPKGGFRDCPMRFGQR